MALSENDIIELVIIGDLLGQLINNRFHYRLVTEGQTGLTENDRLARFWDVFKDNVLIPMLDLQGANMNWREYTLQNLNSSTAKIFGTIVPVLAGTVTGDPLPSFNSASYQLRLPDDTIKWGRKAIAGITEFDVDGNTIVPTSLGKFTDFENNLSDLLPATTADDVFDLVVARIPDGAERPYVPQSLRVSDAIFRGIGTQYSRRAGRGA